MKVTVTEISSIVRKIRVDLDWVDVASQYDATLQKLRKGLKVDGFRPGKVPTDVAKRMLGPRLNYDFSNAVIESNYRDVLKDKHIEKYIDLSISAVDFHEGKDFYYEMTIENDPEITLPAYRKGFSVKKTVYIVDQVDVDLYLEDVREHHAEVKAITTGAENGHYLVCDIQETDEDGIPLVGKKVVDRLIKVGEGIFGEPGSEALIGAKNGEKIQVSLKPKKGKPINYNIAVKRVEEHILPELTDDFIKNNFEKYESLKAFREAVEKSIQAEWDSRAEKEFLRRITDYFIDNTQFDIPPSRINRFLDSVIEDMRARNGDQEIDEKEVRDQYRVVAEREIRWYLIEEALAEQEKIEISKSELDQKISGLADTYPQESRKAVLDYYQKSSNRSHLENDLLEKKVFDHLKQYIKSKQETVHTKEFRKRNT
jgi:trigger factor